MGNFYNIMYRLRFIKRWGTSFNNIEENVAQHSFSVAIITHILCLICSDVYKMDIDLTNAILLALYHECHETYTSHIVSPVRNSSTHMKVCSEEMIKQYKSKSLGVIPANLQAPFSKFLFSSDATVEKNIVEAADIIDAFFKCCFEVMTGNGDFKNKLRLYEQKIKLLRKEKDYVDYFFENFVDFEEFELSYTREL